jgi:hypothetical protein
MCLSSIKAPSLSEGALARQRIFGRAKVGKGRVTVSDLGVGSYPQGAVAEPGEAEGCVLTSRRYSQALDKAMKKCVWLRPELVAQVEFLEWTASERAASDYTRSSNTTREASDHASFSSALWPRV